MNEIVLNQHKKNKSLENNKLFIKELNRKLFHLSSLWIPSLIFFINKIEALFLFGFLLCLDYSFEYANYKKMKWSRYSYGFIFHRIMRSFESKRSRFVLSGGFYVLLSTFLSVLVFSKEIAIISISVMLVSDASAALFGKVYGTHKIYQEKTLEGCLAFFISAVYVVCFYHFLLPISFISIIACFAVTILELYGKALKLDDNFSVPIVLGMLLTVSSL